VEDLPRDQPLWDHGLVNHSPDDKLDYAPTLAALRHTNGKWCCLWRRENVWGRGGGGCCAGRRGGDASPCDVLLFLFRLFFLLLCQSLAVVLFGCVIVPACGFVGFGGLELRAFVSLSHMITPAKQL